MRLLKTCISWLLTVTLCLNSIVQPIVAYAENVDTVNRSIEVADSQTRENDSTVESDSQVSSEKNPSYSNNANESGSSKVAENNDVSEGAEDASSTVSSSSASSSDNAGLVDYSQLCENSWRYSNGKPIVQDNGIATQSLGDDNLPAGAKARGIDVSNFQGTIDWTKVKASGIKFAFLKVGPVRNKKDSTFERNASECERLGIPYGVYYYTYARSVADANRDADNVIAWLGNHHPTLPVYYDVEDNYILKDPSFSKDKLASIVQTFCNRLTSVGFNAGIYANLNWFNNYLNSPSLLSYDHWVAQYNYKCDYKNDFSYWQYSCSGYVPGVAGDCDMNYSYSNLDGAAPTLDPYVSYRAHVSKKGWQSYTTSVAGTTGKSLSIEALQVRLNNGGSNSGIAVKAHVQNIGWQDWVTDQNAYSGTTGRSLRIEALQLKLTGDIANTYDIYYRVHSSSIGWMSWTKNGESAGTQGYGYGVEAVQIRLVKKGDPAPSSSNTATSDSFRRKPASVSYRAHVSKKGWQGYTSGVAGTTGKGLPVEALQITLKNADYSGSVAVKAHVQNIGWQDWVTDSNKYAGTTGRSLRIEALQLKLTGDMANVYDLYYRVHSASIGWMAWTKNGESAGTQGFGRAVEAVEIRLVKKGAAVPSATGSVTSDAFRRKPVSVTYRAHVSNKGWLSTVSDGQTGGTTGQSLGLEALKVSLSNADASGSLQVNAHVSGIGWQGWDKPSSSEGGTTGQSRHIEALQFRLTGQMAQLYDVYYRVHASGIGWMGWTCNGGSAGTSGLSDSLEAVQILLVKKGASAPGSTYQPFIAKPVISYQVLSSNGWTASALTGSMCGSISGQTNLYGFKASFDETSEGTLSYRVHVANKGWLSGVSGGVNAAGDSNTNAIQALQISMQGKLAQRLDVYYRVYIDKIGWTGWAKNGGTSGSVNCSLNIRAVQIDFRVKGVKALGGIACYDGVKSLPYVGYQNPAGLYQVSNHSVNIKNMGSGQFGYRSESRIPYDATRQQLIQTMITRAMDYMNTPYKWDYSCAPGVGADCAGLVMQALYADGMDLSPMNPWDHYYTPGHDHYANDIRNNKRFRHVSFAQRQSGDLIMTKGHVSIYIGNDKVIEAYPPHVQITSVYGPHNKNVLAVVRPIV